ncbi:hypothetical protein OKW41_008982 [Paraburkholderia sp. UCT70]
MVIREVAVDFGEQFDEFAAELPEQLRREPTGHAVAGIDDDLDRTRELHVAHDALEIRVGDVVLGVAAAAVGEVLVDDALMQRENLLAVNGRAAQHHLEAVVVRRIMATRHDDARVDAALAARQLQRYARREVADRCGHHAHVHDIDAGRTQAVGQRPNQLGARQASVARDHDRVAALRAHFAAECATDGTRGVGVERLANDATNVIRLENGFGDHIGSLACNGKF